MSEKKLAACVMVLGTTSGAGKSFLATALCRWYARQGLKVAPFKAQNMSNNARVVACPDGSFGEIGSAQYFQAIAANAIPDVRMNPVLLKPEADTRSQVVLLGQVNHELGQLAWHERSKHVWPYITQSLDELRAENDVVVIEGAGSPAEINLMHSDIVNLRVARHTQARCLLITDIDRGGAFAHLYGTWALKPEADRTLLAGFVLNKFRGDAALLEPGPSMLEKLTGVPVVGTLPMWRNHGLPEEDGVFEDSSRAFNAEQPRVRVAIVAYPHISNLDEFQVLRQIPSLHLVWARHPTQLMQADLIILPGSKNTLTDLTWLQANGFEEALQSHRSQRKRILGICGGMQMLGVAIEDPLGTESAGLANNCKGLGFLSIRTRFAARKTVRPYDSFTPDFEQAWQMLSRKRVIGYEIHYGITQRCDTHHLQTPWVQSEDGLVLGSYVHGLFENPQIVDALFGGTSNSFEAVCEGLADYLARGVRLDLNTLIA